MTREDSENKILPYVSISTEKIQDYLKIIRKNEPISKDKLAKMISSNFDSKNKTAKENILSLENLDLVEKSDGKITLASNLKNSVEKSKLKEIFLEQQYIQDLIESIKILKKEGEEIRFKKGFFSKVMGVLSNKFDYEKRSRRLIDTYLSLFRFLNILQKDEYTKNFYLVSNEDVNKEKFRDILKENYEKLVGNKTSWVKIPELRSKLVLELGIESEKIDEMLKELTENNKDLQFSRASALRKEVKNFGLKVENETYFYVKVAK